MERALVCAGAEASLSVLLEPDAATGTQQALRPQLKVYTILTGYIKNNRFIFVINYHQILGKLTINPV